MATANRRRQHGRTATAHDDYEAALRSLPEAHSLALRLLDAGVADDVISGYLHIEPEGLDTLLDLARRKLQAALEPSPQKDRSS